LHILGLNFSLDAGAVLVRDGRVVAAALEERFDRQKHSAAFPRQAIAFCLKQAGITLEQVDAFAFSWNPAVHVGTPNRLRDTIYRDQREYLELVPAHLLAMSEQADIGLQSRLSLALRDRELDVRYFDHHLCHAAAAFYASGYDQAAILTADGYGEQTTTLLATGNASGITPLRTFDYPHSIGSVYAAVTSFLGFGANNHEGKVMALAGMGNPKIHRARFEQILRTTDDGFEVDLSYFRYYMRGRHRFSDQFVRVFGQPRQPDAPLKQFHYDIAAALQEATDRVLLHLCKLLHKQTGMDKLCLAGGVALNAVAMGNIERKSPFAEIFVLPAAHDGGGGLGAAWLLSQEAGESPYQQGVYTDRLGSVYDADFVKKKLSDFNLRFSELDSAPAAAAEMIAKGKVIGWMNGAMEYGPRALGARSILADPRDAKIKDIVNAKVKYREPFRPFAPVALEEAIDQYFIDARPTPFMNKVVYAKPEAAPAIPAVLHTDGSVRIQTINRAQDGDLYDLISQFRALTGVPMVLNTSLNKRGQPICESVEDALSCLFTSGMDALFIGNCLIEK